MPNWTPSEYDEWKRKQHSGRVGAVQGQVSKPVSAQTLDRCKPILKGVKTGVAFSVSLVVASRRKMDSDNLEGACKFLRDSIAESLGIDDGDERITWEYSQIRSTDEGVIVKITQL